jgi:hypothetical protein
MRSKHVFAVLAGFAAFAILADDASAVYHPTLGRFVERDPGPEEGPAAPRIGQYHDGMNLQQYVRSRPPNGRDPDGLKARVSVDEKYCVIVVTLNIGIYGSQASDALAAQVKQSIESRWNGQTTRKGCRQSDPGNCDVRVVANVKSYPSAEHWTDVQEDNQVKFTGNTVRSWVSPFGMSYGHWQSNEDWAYAHEAGHLMGLGDDYDYITNQPNTGHAGHMMGSYGGTVSQHEIEGILNGHKCPQKCCCEDPRKREERLAQELLGDLSSPLDHASHWGP